MNVEPDFEKPSEDRVVSAVGPTSDSKLLTESLAESFSKNVTVCATGIALHCAYKVRSDAKE